jgi:50S ribosomal subunit-associated GTPase HflX
VQNTDDTVYVSAKQAIGLNALLEKIDDELKEDAPKQVHLAVPQSEGKTLSLLEARSRILAREYQDGLVQMDVEVPESILRRVKKFVVQARN